jgi:hypothetical protein
MNLSNMTTDELYERIRSYANSASDFDLDQQDWYVTAIREILDELDERIADAITEKAE